MSNNSKVVDLDAALKAGKKILFGKIQIILEWNQIAKNCVVGFGTSDKNEIGVQLDAGGDVKLEIKEKGTSLKTVSCYRDKSYPRILTFYNLKPVSLSSGINNFGVVEISFNNSRQTNLKFSEVQKGE